MTPFQIFKRLVRSGNPAFAFDVGAFGELKSIFWKGNQIHYRAKTCDVTHIERILLLGRRCEYRLPEAIQPKTILDAGANIGVATHYFKNIFPDARVVCCEPAAENLTVLRKNIELLSDVSVVPCALGARDGDGSMHRKNPSSFSGFRVREDDAGGVEILSYPSLLQRAGVSAFDLVKVDIEGAEHAFFEGMTDDDLQRIKWIVGEIHGENEWLLFHRLSRYFDIDIRKTLTANRNKFHASNRLFSEEHLEGFELRVLQY